MQANARPYIPAEPCTSSICISFSGEIGIKSQNCKKIGLSCIEYDFSVTTDLRSFNSKPTPGRTVLLFKKISSNQLEIAFRSNETGPMVIDSPIALGATTSRALGSSSITLKPGTYNTVMRADGSSSAIVSIY